MVKHAVNPNQLDLLSPRPMTDVVSIESRKPSSVEGVSVPLLDYYAALGQLATLAGKLNKNTGFRNSAADPRSSNYAALEIQYRTKGKDLLPAIQSAPATKQRLENTITEHFMDKVFGVSTVVEAGLMTEEQATKAAEEDYENFSTQYQGVDNKKALKNKKSSIQRRLTKYSKRHAQAA